MFFVTLAHSKLFSQIPCCLPASRLSGELVSGFSIVKKPRSPGEAWFRASSMTSIPASLDFRIVGFPSFISGARGIMKILTTERKAGAFVVSARESVRLPGLRAIAVILFKEGD